MFSDGLLLCGFAFRVRGKPRDCSLDGAEVDNFPVNVKLNEGVYHVPITLRGAGSVAC